MTKESSGGKKRSKVIARIVTHRLPNSRKARRRLISLWEQANITSIVYSLDID